MKKFDCAMQDGLTGSAWGDWANYTASPLRAFENELGVQAGTVKGFCDAADSSCACLCVGSRTTKAEDSSEEQTPCEDPTPKQQTTLQKRAGCAGSYRILGPRRIYR